MESNIKRKELTIENRQQIEILLKHGLSTIKIAELLKFSERTIRREIKSGTVEQEKSDLSRYKVYRAECAQNRHDEKVSRRGRKLSLYTYGSVLKKIEKMLYKKMSPDAIIGRLRLEGHKTMCTKTLYHWLYNGFIKQDRWKKQSKRQKEKRMISYRNVTAPRITERPKESDMREAGHWEMDLVVSGKGKSGALLVLTERRSRYNIIMYVKDRKSETIISAFNKLEKKYKGKFKSMFKSITCDNGSEFLDINGLETSIYDGKRTAIYYAHPYSSWERGSNENANKLIRKFIKKGEDISKLPIAYIKHIENWINNYPRRLFNYKTAKEVFKVA